MRDDRVYENSSINEKFANQEEYPPCYKELLPGHIGVPSILLGGHAYPLLSNIMKQYSNYTKHHFQQ